MLFASNRILVSTLFLNTIQSLFKLLFKNIQTFTHTGKCKAVFSKESLINPG